VKVSYDKDLASHIVPKPCGGVREGTRRTQSRESVSGGLARVRKTCQGAAEAALHSTHASSHGRPSSKVVFLAKAECGSKSASQGDSVNKLSSRTLRSASPAGISSGAQIVADVPRAWVTIYMAGAAEAAITA
jgi:hypothetical protein